MLNLSANPAMSAKDKAAGGGWVGFELAGQRYALDILCVQEVLTKVAIEAVPGAPSAVLGVINLRGRIVSVVDLRQCLGLPPGEDTPQSHIVIADIGDELMGLRVDGIAKACVIVGSEIKSVPATRGRIPDPLVLGMVGTGDHLLTLLNTQQLALVAAALM